MVKKKAGKRRQLRRRRMRRAILKAFSAVAVIVLVGCALYLFMELSTRIRTEKTAEDLREIYTGTASAEAAMTDQPTEEPAEAMATDEPSAAAETAATDEPSVTAEPTAFAEATEAPQSTPQPMNEYQERFEELYAKNEELIGWIHVNDIIDYPVVWRESDNEYYMDHDFNGDESQAGWIFIDKRNGIDMNDDQLLIYGHNMRNGTMFGELDRYRKLDYVIENPLIELQFTWEAEPRQYVLISLFDASMDKSHSSYIKITNFNFDAPEAKEEYIEQLYRRSLHDLPCQTDAQDQLITLVTCSYSYPNGRFLVVARELREGETEESVRERFSRLK